MALGLSIREGILSGSGSLDWVVSSSACGRFADRRAAGIFRSRWLGSFSIDSTGLDALTAAVVSCEAAAWAEQSSSCFRFAEKRVTVSAGSRSTVSFLIDWNGSKASCSGLEDCNLGNFELTLLDLGRQKGGRLSYSSKSRGLCGLRDWRIRLDWGSHKCMSRKSGRWSG